MSHPSFWKDSITGQLLLMLENLLLSYNNISRWHHLMFPVYFIASPGSCFQCMLSRTHHTPHNMFQDNELGENSGLGKAENSRRPSKSTPLWLR
jgi:hypothetical protein